MDQNNNPIQKEQEEKEQVLKIRDKESVDFVIEDPKADQHLRSKNVSGFFITLIMVLLIVALPMFMIFENYYSTKSIKELEGWYAGRLVYQTAENDPEGVYDDFPRYLVAGTIPVVVEVTQTEEGFGNLQVYDVDKEAIDINYTIWIEDNKLMGEPVEGKRNIQTRLDLFGDVNRRNQSNDIVGSLGIKDLQNNVIAIFNMELDKKEGDPSQLSLQPISVEEGSSEAEQSAGIGGVWFDTAQTKGLRFAIVNKGSVIDPLKGNRILFEQESFILFFLDNEYEVIPYRIDGEKIEIEATYLFTKGGQILVNAEDGTWLIDESIFEGHPMIKVKLGELEKSDISKAIEIKGKGLIDRTSGRVITLSLTLVDGDLKRQYDLILEKLRY